MKKLLLAAIIFTGVLISIGTGNTACNNSGDYRGDSTRNDSTPKDSFPPDTTR